MDLFMRGKSPAFRIWIVFLTFAAGFVNVAAMRRFASNISHHTGNMSKIAFFISERNFGPLADLLIAVICFFTGAFVSGLMFYQRKFALKKRYGIFLMSFSLCFLTISFFYIPKKFQIAILAFILGMQNGMFIYYGDVIVRTTHITGYLTDAAFSLGMAVRGDKTKIPIAFFYLINIAAFLTGGIFSGVMEKTYIFPLCACMYFSAGLYYFILRKTTLHR